VIDEDAISSYLFLGYVPQDLAPINGVNKLLPGCKLTLAPQGNLAVTSYWSYAEYLSEDRPLEPGELVSLLKAELGRQVPQGEVGYVAQGTMPSAALASQLPHGTALTTEYPGQNEEEVQAALRIGEALGQGMQTTSFTPATLLDSLPNIVWHLDEPLADPSVMGLWNLLQGGAERICSDVGCAELLATHPRYYDPKLAHLLTKPPPAAHWGPLKKFALHLLHSITKPGLFHWLRKSHAHPWLAYFFGSEALFSPKMLRQLSPQIPRLFNPDIFITRIFQLSGLGDTQNAFLFLDERTKLPGKLLLPLDRLCSAAQKPWSAPFLSEGIAELMARVPNEQKLAPDPTQHPLYQLIDPNLRKTPFTPPQGRTFLNPYLNDATVKQAFDYLTRGTLVESGWLDRKWIKRALERRLPEPVTFTQLWGLLHLEVWMRLFINTPVTTSPPDAPLFQVLQRG